MALGDALLHPRGLPSQSTQSHSGGFEYSLYSLDICPEHKGGAVDTITQCQGLSLSLYLCQEVISGSPNA